MTTWLIITRAVHFGSCLLLFGLMAFDRLVAPAFARRPSEIVGYWEARLRLFVFLLLPIIFISWAAWFALVAMTMSGEPLQMQILKIVWSQTLFGAVWKIRLMFLLAAAALSFLLKPHSRHRPFAAWSQLAAGGCLLGTLAWAGHGQEDSRWHLYADVLHLIAAGVWPAGLVPLFLLLRQSRRAAASTDWPSISGLVRRFSLVSLAAVSLLAATGFVNSLFLVGTLSNLVGDVYGRWLLAKIILFCAAVAIAAVNLLRLKPRLLNESSQPEKALMTAAQLQRNVHLELFLGAAVIIIVAVLGILPPAQH